MKIRFDSSPLRESRWSGHLARFVVGGTSTVLAWLVTRAAGPTVGGLLLALPAIFPTGIALVTKLHNRKTRPGSPGDRARRAALIEAAGAATGSAGLVGFALVCWSLLVRWPAWTVLTAATTAWGVIAFAGWWVRKARL